jgi:hypothetical protein
MRTCPYCGIEFEPTVNQTDKEKYLIGYKPNCRSKECHYKAIRSGGFNQKEGTF